MVRLVIEAPLTDGERCAAILDLFDHIDEVGLLLCSEILVFLDCVDLDVVLGFGLGRLRISSGVSICTFVLVKQDVPGPQVSVSVLLYW
jgi:hypothetical protein